MNNLKNENLLTNQNRDRQWDLNELFACSIFSVAVTTLVSPSRLHSTVV